MKKTKQNGAKKKKQNIIQTPKQLQTKQQIYTITNHTAATMCFKPL